jgi:DNA adenine methylase
MLPIILKDRAEDQLYVEPFAGGFNMVDKVAGPRYASDTHPYLIALFEAVRDGWRPPVDVDKDIYEDVRSYPDQWPDYFVGFVGFGCSFGGKWFAGFAQGGTTARGEPRNHAAESSRALIKQAPKLAGVTIRCHPYGSLSPNCEPLADPCVIYCDPPYASTTGYKETTFDHPHFWQWCRDMSDRHAVFVSEYTAPPDFESVWQKPIKTNSVKRVTSEKPAIEQLWRYAG